MLGAWTRDRDRSHVAQLAPVEIGGDLVYMHRAPTGVPRSRGLAHQHVTEGGGGRRAEAPARRRVRRDVALVRAARAEVDPPCRARFRPHLAVASRADSAVACCAAANDRPA